MFEFSALPLSVNFAAFLVSGGIVLLCGVRLTRLADRFADISGIGEAVTGAVFLGALTSLSGSVTSMTAAHHGHADLALSNAIGGIAAQTAFLVIADLAYRRANLEHAAASLPNMISGTVLIFLLAVLLIANTLPAITILGVHPVSLALFFLYGFGVRIAARTRQAPMWSPDQTKETQEDLPDEPPGDGRSIIGLLGIILGLGTILGFAGWIIAETGLVIAATADVREGLVGALMTSVVTSTPELVTTVAAVRRGALTLAVGGILGGNTFDVLFAAFSDIAYRSGSIYHAITPELTFLTSLTIVMTATLLLGLLRRERHGPANIGFESVALLVLYLSGVAALVWAF